MQVAKYPIIGLNQDDDDVNLKPGWCREIRNAIPKNGYSKTGIQNIAGTLIKTNGDLAAGDNICLGMFSDTYNTRIFYFLHNSNNDHSIWYFTPTSDTHTKVLQSRYLKFSLSYPILSCDFIEDILQWTDGNNEARSLIVAQAVVNGYDFNDQPSFEKQISLFKVRPDLPPISARSPGTSGFNNITADSFQFCTQYVYNDNSVTKPSPASELNPADVYPRNTNSNNQIQIIFYVDISLLNIIKKVYVLYIKNGNGQYYLFKEYTISELGAPFSSTSTHNLYSILFYNTDTAQRIEVNNVNLIPNKTNSIMIHEQRNYITMNEFDYEEWDGTITASTSSVYSLGGGVTRLFLPNSSYTVGVMFFDYFGRTPGVTKTTTLKFGNIKKTLGVYALSSPESLALTWTLSGTPPSWAKSYAIVLKKNNTYQACFSCLAIPMFYLRDDNESATHMVDDNKVYYKNPPTTWAKQVYWKFPQNIPFTPDASCKLRLLNTLSGATRDVEDIISLEGDKIVTENFGISNWNTAIGANTGLIWVMLEIPKSIPEEAFFEIGKHYDCSSGALSTTTAVVNGDHHYIFTKLIYAPFASSNVNYINNLFDDRFNETGVEHLKPIEVNAISQSPTNAVIYLSDPITTVDKQHKTGVSKTLRTLEDTASAIPFFGISTYVAIARASNTDFAGNVADKIEGDASQTDTTEVRLVYTPDYNKIAADWGRPWLQVKNKKISSEPNTISISDTYVVGSKINGINDFSNLYPVAINRTQITKLVNVTASNVFLAIHKRSTSSFATYAGARILNTTDGSQILSDGRNIIGYDNELAGGYGTIYPDSIVSNKGRTYFFDPFQGEVIRYSQAGLTPIGSIYKMATYFKRKGQQFSDSTSRNVIAGYDNKLNLLYITFRSADSSEEETAIFVERNGEERWISLNDFLPDKYASMNNRLFSFMDGSLWEHNVNTTYNLFYNTPHSTSIKHLFSSEISHEKMLLNVSVESNKQWEFDPILSNRYNPITGGTIEQETSLAKSNFVRRDNIFYADVMRDKNTVSGLLPAGKTGLVAGQPLIGKVYEVNLENDDSELVELDFINYGYTQQSGHRIV